MSGRLKKLTISEGVVVVSATEEGTSTTSYAQYASDAEYELDNASFSDGAVYYNTTTDTIRIYVSSTWQDIINVTALTASRALISDGSGDIAVSTVTSTELGYISGLTSSAQTQINNKISSSSTDTLTNKTINGSNNTISNISLTSSITGTLPVSNGGTGQSLYTTGDILYASSSSALVNLGIGTADQVLSVSSGVPTWKTISAVTSTTVAADYISPTTTNIADNTQTTIVFGTPREDTDSAYNTSTGEYTIPSIGYYLTIFELNCSFSSPASGSYLRLYISSTVSGSTTTRSAYFAAPASSIYGGCITQYKYYSSGDIVKAAALQNSGATQSTSTGYFQIFKLR